MNKLQKIIFTIFIIIELVNISSFIINYCNKNYSGCLINIISIIIACSSLSFIFRGSDNE